MSYSVFQLCLLPSLPISLSILQLCLLLIATHIFGDFSPTPCTLYPWIVCHCSELSSVSVQWYHSLKHHHSLTVSSTIVCISEDIQYITETPCERSLSISSSEYHVSSLQTTIPVSWRGLWGLIHLSIIKIVSPFLRWTLTMRLIRDLDILAK